MLSVSATKRCSSPTPSMSVSDASPASSTTSSSSNHLLAPSGKGGLRPESSRQMVKDLLVKFTVLTIAATALVTIALSFAGAFFVEEKESAVEEGSDAACDGQSSDDSVATEAAQSFLVFVLGFLSCFFMKKRHDLARRFDGLVARATATVSVANTHVASLVRFRPQWPSWLNQGFVSIVVSGLLCTGCVVYLFVSVFQAEPGAEPDDIGGSPDPSTKTKVFTIGWMVVLSFKLRRELVSLVGNGALFQPW